ncbi:MAG: sigma-E processing peptidase SpoIIGA [Candidatus Caccovivens sp.]
MSLEYIFFINFIINFLILKTCALFLKDKGRWFLLSAFLGSCFAIALQFYRLSNLGQVLLSMGLTIWYVCISFKFKTIKKFLQIYASYMLCTFLYGGVCYYMATLITSESIFYILFAIFVIFVVVDFILKKFHRKKAITNFCRDVEIENSGKICKCQAFLDSGNLLYDPVTQKPVCLINFKLFSKLFPDISLEDILRRSEKVKTPKFAHYIKFGTLTNSDKILVFQVGKICIDGQVTEKATLGLVLKDFNQTFGTDMILHNNFA